jgi:hypothetical protein
MRAACYTHAWQMTPIIRSLLSQNAIDCRLLQYDERVIAGCYRGQSQRIVKLQAHDVRQSGMRASCGSDSCTIPDLPRRNFFKGKESMSFDQGSPKTRKSPGLDIDLSRGPLTPVFSLPKVQAFVHYSPPGKHFRLHCLCWNDRDGSACSGKMSLHLRLQIRHTRLFR